MNTEIIIGALGSAIVGMAGFIVFLVKYVLADKDRQIAARDAWIQERMDDKDRQIEAWKAADTTNAKVAAESLQLARDEKVLLLNLEKQIRGLEKRKPQA